MSVSTNGILVYGIDLSEGDEGYATKVPWVVYDEDGNEVEDEDVQYTDIEDWWVINNAPNEYAAYNKAFDTYPEQDCRDVERRQANLKKWQEKNKDVTEAYYSIREKLLEQLPVEVVYHCSDESPMYFLAVKGHVHKASRGYPEEIETLVVDDEAVAKAIEFCDKYGIVFMPKWYLASLWS